MQWILILIGAFIFRNLFCTTVIYLQVESILYNFLTNRIVRNFILYGLILFVVQKIVIFVYYKIRLWDDNKEENLEQPENEENLKNIDCKDSVKKDVSIQYCDSSLSSGEINVSGSNLVNNDTEDNLVNQTSSSDCHKDVALLKPEVSEQSDVSQYYNDIYNLIADHVEKENLKGPDSDENKNPSIQQASSNKKTKKEELIAVLREYPRYSNLDTIYEDTEDIEGIKFCKESEKMSANKLDVKLLNSDSMISAPSKSHGFDKDDKNDVQLDVLFRKENFNLDDNSSEPEIFSVLDNLNDKDILIKENQDKISRFKSSHCSTGISLKGERDIPKSSDEIVQDNLLLCDDCEKIPCQTMSAQSVPVQTNPIDLVPSRLKPELKEETSKQKIDSLSQNHSTSSDDDSIKNLQRQLKRPDVIDEIFFELVKFFEAEFERSEKRHEELLKRMNMYMKEIIEIKARLEAMKKKRKRQK